jgi:ferric-dicitrate binding protein FerR (iron transport regulator)
MTEYQEQLLLKSLSGTISSEELKTLTVWLNQSEENKKLANDFTILWKHSSKKDTLQENFQTKEEWEKLEAAIQKMEMPQGKEIALKRQVPWLKIAASVTLMAVCSALLYVLFFSQETILKESHDSIVEVVLPDGSEVWLNRNSRLTYQDNFNEENRLLKLEGEAFFDVRKDPQKPFVIQTGKAKVEVLGTSFNVEAYAGSAETEIFVVTGLVSFSGLSDSKGITVKPGEAGVLKNKNLSLISQGKQLNALAWKEKRLIFKKTALSDVVKALEEYFNVDIEVKNKNALRCRFTGSFDKPSLSEIIEALGVSLDLNIVEQRDSVYVVEGNGC